MLERKESNTLEESAVLKLKSSCTEDNVDIDWYWLTGKPFDILRSALTNWQEHQSSLLLFFSFQFLSFFHLCELEKQIQVWTIKYKYKFKLSFVFFNYWKGTIDFLFINIYLYLFIRIIFIDTNKYNLNFYKNKIWIWIFRIVDLVYL